MKKTLLAAVLLVGLGAASQAHAAPYDWFFNLNDDLGSPYTFTVDGQGPNPMVLMYRPGGHLPYLAPMNGGLQLDTGTNELVVKDIPQSGITGLSTTFSGITTALAGKANATHGHSTSDIAGLGTFVSNWMASSSALTFATSTRSLNTAFQVSATKAAMVTYTVDIGATLSLTSGETGTVTLQYADDSGFTTNVKTVQSSANGNTGTLAIGLGLTQTSTASLTGIIPAGKYVKLVTANTAGTPTFTYRNQQEVILPMT